MSSCDAVAGRRAQLLPLSTATVLDRTHEHCCQALVKGSEGTIHRRAFALEMGSLWGECHDHTGSPSMSNSYRIKLRHQAECRGTTELSPELGVEQGWRLEFQGLPWRTGAHRAGLLCSGRGQQFTSGKKSALRLRTEILKVMVGRVYWSFPSQSGKMQLLTLGSRCG